MLHWYSKVTIILRKKNVIYYYYETDEVYLKSSPRYQVKSLPRRGRPNKT